MKNFIKIVLISVLWTSQVFVYAQTVKSSLLHKALPARLISKAAATQYHNYTVSEPVRITPLQSSLIYTPVEKIHTLHEKRIDKDVAYGIYMIENIRGGNNQRAYPCQDRVFAGTMLGKILFAVCDGHGDKGDSIAQDAVEQFPLEVFKHKEIKYGLVAACKKLQERYKRTANAQQSGTTLVAGTLQDDVLTVANVGDSRLIVIRPSRESIPFSTVDHKGKPGAMLALSRSLGDIDMHKLYGLNAEPDVTKINLEDNDVIVIASDGYWDMLTNNETYDLVIAGINARLDCKALAQKLAEAARARKSKDDITVVCIRYKAK
jgi:serine/threonine protein phosphatase PrpC